MMVCEKFPKRYILVCIGFLCTFNLYSLRLNLSIAIVDMVDFEKLRLNLDDRESALSANITSPSYFEDSTVPYTTVNTNTESQKFIWDSQQQGLLLSCYYYGYIVTQVLGAFLGRRFGRVRVLGACVFCSSTLTILFPLVAKNIGYASIVIVRVLIGLFSGVTMPSLFGITSAWAPVSERSKCLAIQFAGIPAGAFVVMPIGGLLANAFGWESVFYATGSFGILWVLLWVIMVHESPETHPGISAKERKLIRGNDVTEESAKSKRPVPWWSILSSRAWMCLAFTHFASLFGKYQLMTMLPSYLRTVLDFNIKTSGFLSSIPFLLNIILLFVSGPLADFLIARKFRSIYVRKALTTIGLMMSCISIIVVTYIGNNVSGVLALFTISVGMDAFVVPGFKACIMEITPEFCGIAYGLSNTVSTISGILAPQITGIMRSQFSEDPITGWRVSFWIGGLIYFLGAIVFLIFGTNEKQPWSYDKTKRSSLDEMKPLPV